MKRPSLRNNIFFMFLWQISNYAIPLLTFPYLTRVLGVTQFGIYALSFAVASYFVLVTDWGFALAAPGQIARAGDNRTTISRIFWSTLAAKAVLACGAFVVLAIAALAIPAVRVIAPVLFCASGLVVANVLTVNWCLQGLERLGKFATAATIGRALTVPATLLLVKSPSDTWIAALVQSGGGLVVGLISITMLRGLRVIERHRVSWPEVASQLREGWPLFVSALSATLYTSTNTVALGALRGPALAGIFGAADRLRMAAQYAILPISQAVYPRSSKLMHEDRDAGLAFARKLIVYQGALAGLISLVMALGAPLIITILAGRHFEASIDVLRCLAPIPFLVGIGNVLGVQVLLPLGMKSTFGKISAFAAAFDIVIVIPLSWWFGAVGTALAAVAAEGLVVALMLSALHRAGISILPFHRDRIV